jgi:hypothetical protein
MKRGRLLLILFLLLLTTGCGPSHEEMIRQRAELLIAHLVDEDYEACIELTDPEFVQRKGTDGTKVAYQVLGVFVKLGNITRDSVRIDQITIAEDATTATADLSLQIGDTWRPLQQPLKWQRVEGQWYMEF